ncbi:MAG: DUF58 domain-containing protein [Bifidobacteriaceae bacterium]|nr:DUF58 domain-containing protein [Bifidobacteriaceae bacterium]
MTALIRPLGWGTLVAALATLGTGLTWEWSEFVMAALGLGAALVVAAAFVLGRNSYRVTLDLARLRVKVGEEALGQIVVENPTGRALLPSLAALVVGRGSASFRIPRLAAGRRHDETFQIPTSRRAVVSVGPVRSWRGDGLGLLRREVSWSGSYELFVHPHTVSLQGSSAGFLRDLEGKPTDDLSSSDVAFHALREYVPGDDRRHIHWKTSARIGKFMVRQFEETRRSHLALALSTDLEDYADEDQLELAIAVAASLGIQAITEGKDLTVVTSSGNLMTETGMRLLDDCSRVEPVRGQAQIQAVAVNAAAQVPDASVAVLLAGSAPDPHAWRRAAARFPVDVTVVVVRCLPGAELKRRMLGGAVMLELGALADLPKGMRTV